MQVLQTLFDVTEIEVGQEISLNGSAIQEVTITMVGDDGKEHRVVVTCHLAPKAPKEQ